MIEKVANNAQEQVVGAIIEQIVQARLEDLKQALEYQDLRFEQALKLVAECERRIREEVVECGLGRGGEKGMHGFIAEYLEVYVGNARKVMAGKISDMLLDNDNGVADFHVGNAAYQSKFVLRYLGMDSLIAHAEKYPEFVKSGGRYSLASDLYERLAEIAGVPETDFESLTSVEQTLWIKVQRLRGAGIEPGKNLEPSAFGFRDVQRENYEGTIARERESIRKIDEGARRGIEADHSPTLGEAAKATAAGATLEAGMSLGLAVYRKIKGGKKLAEFTSDDWKDLGVEAAKGGARGAFRGGTVYLLTTFTKLPGATATAAATATLGMGGQAMQLRAGSITPSEFIENSEILCLDSAVSALSALMGQVLIPLPVFGALVGNVAGSLAYEIAKTNLSKYEQDLISDALARSEARAQVLNDEYEKLAVQYHQRSLAFGGSLELAFSMDANTSLEASVEHARLLGVPEKSIIKSFEEGTAYFES